MSLFDNLQPPQVIQPLSYESIVAALLADGRARFLSTGFDYDVGNLEFDPFKIFMEASSFRELDLRARINDVAKTRFVPFAIGSDLDYLAADNDVVRMVGETDARLRKRIILAISGRSPGGSAQWYISAAMRADIRVEDARIFRTGIGPELTLAVLSSDNGGIADAALLAAVNTIVQSDSVRVVSDRITVVAATKDTVNISAQIWLLPDASQTIMSQLEPQLRGLFDDEGGLGFDLKRTWITARLHQTGVARVNLLAPTIDMIAAPNSAIAIGTVTLIYMGRDR